MQSINANAPFYTSLVIRWEWMVESVSGQNVVQCYTTRHERLCEKERKKTGMATGGGQMSKTLASGEEEKKK